MGGALFAKPTVRKKKSRARRAAAAFRLSQAHRSGLESQRFFTFLTKEVVYVLHKLLYHIVYATKERRPYLAPSWRTDMHDYLGGTIRGLKGTAMEIGGIEDHVHLLTSIPPTISVSEFMSKLKANSSNWGKHRSGQAFGWQDGYSAFTVSESQTEGVRDYIRNQEVHHHQRTFAQELASLLKKHKIPYDKNIV